MEAEPDSEMSFLKILDDGQSPKKKRIICQ